MSRQFRFAPDPGGGSADDVWFKPVVSVKATLQPGAGRARKARRAPLGWQPIPCLSQQRLGGRWKASPNFTRAARPERGEGDSQEEGEPSGSLSSCAQCGRGGRIPARDARAPRPPCPGGSPAARSGTSTHFGKWAHLALPGEKNRADLSACPKIKAYSESSGAPDSSSEETSSSSSLLVRAIEITLTSSPVRITITP